jgi:hypothetical protein
MLPPEPDELILLIYSCEALNASEKMEKCNGGSPTNAQSYLVESDLRSWSRAK